MKKQKSLNIDDFVFGKKIDSEQIFIATAKSTDKALICKVQKALDEFMKTDEYKNICRKYLNNETCSKDNSKSTDEEKIENNVKC